MYIVSIALNQPNNLNESSLIYLSKGIFLTSFFTLVLSNAFAQAIDALPPANNTEYPDATFEFTYSWNTLKKPKT